MSLKHKSAIRTANGLTRADVMRMAKQHKTQRVAVLSGAVREVGAIGTVGEALDPATVMRIHRQKLG